jgi:hypothetical protein
MQEKNQYTAVAVISGLFSLVSVPFAVFVTRCANDGGRGGAIGVAIALLFLFITRDYGTKLYNKLVHDLPELKVRLERGAQTDPAPQNATSVPVDQRVAQLEREVAALVRQINIDAEGQREQNFHLAWVTAFGTLVWGFGDLLAKLWIQYITLNSHCS